MGIGVTWPLGDEYLPTPPPTALALLPQKESAPTPSFTLAVVQRTEVSGEGWRGAYSWVTVGEGGAVPALAPHYLEHTLLRGLQRFPLWRVHELVREDVVKKLPILAHTNSGKGREETMWRKGSGHLNPPPSKLCI